jgi:hypothetical protein
MSKHLLNKRTLLESNRVAILAIFKANKITKEMYEALRKEVDWEHQHPDGVVLHAAAFDNAGANFRVVDIWESEEHLNKFVTSRLLPVMKKINMPMPEGEIFQINDVSAFPAIHKYIV